MTKTNKKIYLNKIGDNVDFHTPLMGEFLEDTYENCGKYADGMEAKDNPLPIKFSWDSDKNYRYILKISENADMEDPWVFETDECEYDVYNLKVGKRYYWTVIAMENGEVVNTAEVESFTTNDAPPRNLLVEGIVCNVRDIGGWKTLDGKKVKQGLIYRSSTLDDYDPTTGEERVFVDDIGKSRMKLLGIRTEIDFRMDSSEDKNYPPYGKTSSCLGDEVEYYHCPIMVGPENYLKSINSLRTIFKLFADESKYPITYHCAVGADRTGAITYLLNGLLGVEKETLLKEYMLTNFSKQYKFRPPINEGYVEIINNYEGTTLRDKIYNYLSVEIGISKDDLDFIIDYLTE